jgi:hypothetical protein
MNIADLLCSPAPTEEGEEEKPGPVEQREVAPVSVSSKGKKAQVVTKKNGRTFAVLPDKQRKRQYCMSKTQKQHRRDHEAFESRVFNLTLDVNALKQEVKRLMEIRDLQVTQLLLSRHHLENDLLLATETMVRSLRHDRSGPTDCRYLSTTEEGRAGHAPAARGQCGNMFEFAIQMDKIKSTCIIKDLRVLTFVEEGAEPEDEATAEVRQVCGPGGGCLVEVVGDFTTSFERYLILAMFPQAAGDEVLLSRLVGHWFLCPSRLLLYFNSKRELVWQLGQSDVVSALQQVRPKEMATLMNRAFDAHDW